MRRELSLLKGELLLLRGELFFIEEVKENEKPADHKHLQQKSPFLHEAGALRPATFQTRLRLGDLSCVANDSHWGNANSRWPKRRRQEAEKNSGRAVASL